MCGGEAINCKSAVIQAVTTNSKLLQPGDLFIALKGKKTDGNLYIEYAIKAGAYIFSNHKGKANIYVEDTEKAILKLASNYKKLFKSIFLTVAITGSVGKTTTKEILSHFARKKHLTHCTYGNQNNSIGLAYTLLSIPINTEILVVELGMNNIGEISALSKAAEPNIGIITNIGHAHIGNLKTKENIAKAKLEIKDGIKEYKLILPFDEPLFESEKKAYKVSSNNFFADYYAIISLHNTLSIKTPIRKIDNISIPLTPPALEHGIAFTLPILDFLNYSDDDVISAINDISPKLFRQKEFKLNGYIIYDDTYSSSPEALIENLRSFSILHKENIECVLGDMLELGEKSEEFHELIGKKTAEYGFSKLFAFGQFSDNIKKGAISGGMHEKNIFTNDNINEPDLTANQILCHSSKEASIIFKGSHEIRLDRIILKIKELTEAKENA